MFYVIQTSTEKKNWNI